MLEDRTSHSAIHLGGFFFSASDAVVGLDPHVGQRHPHASTVNGRSRRCASAPWTEVFRPSPELAYSGGHAARSSLAIILAPFVGSFLGVVVERLPAGRSIVSGRSRCDHCGETLTARDLIPFVSYLARGGWCSCGRGPLSWFHPGIELAALGVALSAAMVLSGWLLWASLGLGWTLLTLAAIDWREFVLPDIITLPLILVASWSRGRSIPDCSAATHWGRSPGSRHWR